MTKLKIMPHAVEAYLKGVGVENVELDANNHLIVYLDNGETVDAGEFKVDDEVTSGSKKPVAGGTLYQALASKVNRVTGKGLSTNDYTDEDKEQVERVRDGSVVVENTLSEVDETSNKPVSGKGVAKAIEVAVYPISGNIGQIGLHETYRSGNLLYIVQYSPYRQIFSDTTIKVTPSNASTIKGVSIAVIRDGSVKYLPLSKANDFYYFQALAGDEVVNLYVNNAGEEGEVVKVQYVVVGSIASKVDALEQDSSQYRVEINALRKDLDVLVDEAGLHETYRSGDLLYIVEYSPYRQFLSDTTIKVTPSNASTIKGVSITVKRDGSVKYLPLSKANDFYYFQALAGDEVVNLYVNNAGEEGEVVKVQYVVDLIRWMAIGDSLTSAYTLGEGSDNYVSLVAKRLGIVAINKGVGGSGYWKTKNINTAFFQRIPTYPEEADVITIFGSFNDLATEDGVSGASVIGEISDTTTDTICGCINATLDAIEEYYPNAIVGIITPTPWSNSHASINPESYVTKLKEIAEYRSIPCLDLFHSSNLRPWEESFREMYYINKEDGTHPNTLGHKRISGMITNFIQSIMF